MAIYTNIFGGSPIQPAFASYNLFELDSDIVLQWPTSFQDTDYVVSGIMNVNPTISGYTIQLPDARFVSPGIAFFFINISPNQAISFNVLNAAGFPIIQDITSVEGYFLYLQKNTTPEGDWGILPFSGSDAITYLGAVSNTPGLTIVGSPITGAGTLEFSVDLETLWNNIPNNSLTGSKLLLDSMPAGVLVDGSLTNTQFTPNTISGNILQNGSVASAKLANNTLLSLWNTQANNSLTGVKLLLDSMPAGVLVDGSLTNTQFTPNTISGNIIADGSIPPEKLIAGPFDLTALWNAQADNTLTGSKILNNSLNGSKLTDTSVSPAKLTANTLSTLWTGQGNGTLTGAKIGTLGSLNGNLLANNSVPASALIGGGTQPFCAGNINSSGVANRSINILTITVISTGRYRIKMTTAANSSNYVILSMVGVGGGSTDYEIFNTSEFLIQTTNSVGTHIARPFCFAVFNI